MDTLHNGVKKAEKVLIQPLATVFVKFDLK